jgi:NADPH-dependent curcumin reductase CurA
LLVSGAAGSVGSLVCQLGKKTGAKVIAIAGSEEKCNWLKNELGVDLALNYKNPTFKADFKEIGPVDVYFDNVGGDILDMALTQLNMRGRVVLCGTISGYSQLDDLHLPTIILIFDIDNKPQGIQNYTNLIVKRAKIEGFLV